MLHEKLGVTTCQMRHMVQSMQLPSVTSEISYYSQHTENFQRQHAEMCVGSAVHRHMTGLLRHYSETAKYKSRHLPAL